MYIHFAVSVSPYDVYVKNMEMEAQLLRSQFTGEIQHYTFNDFTFCF